MSPRKSVSPEDRKGYDGREIPVFCKKVREKRIELGFTQEELAHKCGTTTPRISQLELGRLPRDENRIIALARALGVDINWLFGFTPEYEAEKQPPHP